MGISVVIPVYNSAQTIGLLIQRLEKSLVQISGEFEVVMVNDGSHDQSWTEIKRLCRKYSWLTGIDLTKNFGQHNAILCGIRMAKYDYIVTMDDDLQHQPEEIRKMLAKLNDGFDVVYGVDPKTNHSVFRLLGSKGLKFLLSKALNDPFVEKMTAFRVFRTNLRKSFESYSGDTVCLDALLSWGAGSIGFAEVQNAPRFSGESNYSLLSLVRHGVNNFSAFYAFPLQLMSMIGALFSIFGLVLLGLILTNYLVHGSVVPGFAFLASIIAVFSGVQLLSLCIMGEYVSRIHGCVLQRPPYSIHSVITGQK